MGFLYALFAVDTIFLGALLGLGLICIVDYLCPPKKAHRQSFSETKEKVREGGEVEEVPADELEDDEPEHEDAEEQESTSEEGKISGSDSDVPKSNTNITEDIQIKDSEQLEKDNENKEHDDDNDAKDGDDNEKSSSQEIRKRKPRKAD